MDYKILNYNGNNTNYKILRLNNNTVINVNNVIFKEKYFYIFFNNFIALKKRRKFKLLLLI